MLIYKGMHHYKEISVTRCIVCDAETYDVYFCDKCANIQFQRLIENGYTPEQRLEWYEKYYIVHDPRVKRLEALHYMLSVDNPAHQIA